MSQVPNLQQPQAISVLDRLWTPSSAAEQINPWIKALIYGDPGAGKTVFASSAPGALFLDTENSTEVLDDWPEYKGNLAGIIKIKSFNDLVEILSLLIRNDPALEHVQTVVIDTLTELQRKNLDEILAFESARNAERDPYQLYQNDYKKSTEMIRRVITNFRDLNRHLIILAHRTEEKDNVGRVTIRPDVTPKLASTLKGVMGLQGFMSYEVTTNEAGQEIYRNGLYTKQTPQIEAKSRLRHLPAWVENPTFNDLLKAKQVTLEGGS